MKDIDLKKFYGAKEKPIFCGKPSKPLYPIAETIVFGIIFVLVMVADGFLAGASVFKEISGEDTLAQVIIISAAFVLHVVPFAVWGINIVKKFYLATRTFYVITAKQAKIVRIYERTEVVTLDLAEADGVLSKKNGLEFSLKEDKFFLPYLPDPDAVVKALCGEKKEEVAK